MWDKSLLKNWGFEENIIIEKENTQSENEREDHVWTINKGYILKLYKNEEEIKNSYLMANLLKKANVATQRLINTLNNEDYVEVDNRYYALFKKIKGEVLNDCFKEDFEKLSFNIGKALGELHIGLNNITEEVKQNKSFFDNNLKEELKGWVKVEIDKYVDKSGLEESEISSFKECVNDLEKNFYESYKELPRQIIHRDFHIGNIIFEGNKVVGFIDFDLSQINARLFDLCYILTASLSTVFNKIEMREKWIRFARGIIKGYEEVNKLEDKEVKSIKYMMYSIEMIMIAYFAQNGYKEIANSNIKIVNYLKEVEILV